MCRNSASALINDDRRWQRGGEFLRLAARGLPALGPTLFVQIAKAHRRVDNLEGALHNFELAKPAGRAVGPKNLADPERQAYFATVKYLGELALSRDDLDAAIENFHLYTESERSGIETLHILADLYERKGDVLSALRFNDMAMVYNAKDKDLLARKDRYYYSVMPEQLQARLETMKAGFDLDYCLQKARTILDGRHYDSPEWLDVADHLDQAGPGRAAEQPGGQGASGAGAAALRRTRRGDRAAGKRPQSEAGEVRQRRRRRGVVRELSTARRSVHGDQAGPDLAVPCYQEFRKSSRSGARTLFKLGQAYEQLGDPKRAMKFYEMVTAYEGNPLTSEAYDALSRLRSAVQETGR